MAIILQIQIFSWKMVEISTDLQRLELVLSSVLDEQLMRALEAERKGRRDDYPIRSTWNRVIAGIVIGHESVESLWSSCQSASLQGSADIYTGCTQQLQMEKRIQA